MGQATIGQAEAAIAGMPGLSDQQRRDFTAEVEQAKAEASAAGLAEAARIAFGVAERRDGLLMDLCKARDDLAAAKASGDRKAMANARTRHQALTAEVEEIERLTERCEEIEADPAAYGEAIFNKYPGTRPNFTFI
jgi:hypothetical protein